MHEIVVVCEAEADFRLATALADRICEEHAPDWVADNLEHFRVWQGIEPRTSFTAWKNVKELAKTYRIGRYLGHPGKSADHAAATKVLRLALKQGRHAVILLRDGDSQTHERRQGLEEARQDFPKPLPILIGVADTKREAWVLHGFECQNPVEAQKLTQLCHELGFDPCVNAHRLRTISQEGAANRQVKTVLETLTNGDFERERACWEEIPLSTLRERGEATGLTDFLHELAQTLPSLLQRNVQT